MPEVVAKGNGTRANRIISGYKLHILFFKLGRREEIPSERCLELNVSWPLMTRPEIVGE